MLKAAIGLNNAQLARRFHVSVQTIRNWFRRLRDGDDLLAMPEKVTRYPDYLRYVVQQLKVMCPLFGKRKMADFLARAGLHLSASTVGRIVKEPPIDPKAVDLPDEPLEPTPGREIIANYAEHVWSADLTEIPIHTGFWTPWSPNALTQRWPYCWHLLTAIAHFSRRSCGLAVFDKAPTAEKVTAALDRMIDEQGSLPKYIVVDRGKQFNNDQFRQWCVGRGIKWRFGALGKHGSLAVTERLNRTLKDECARRILVPADRTEFEAELSAWR